MPPLVQIRRRELFHLAGAAMAAATCGGATGEPTATDASGDTSTTGDIPSTGALDASTAPTSDTTTTVPTTTTGEPDDTTAGTAATTGTTGTGVVCMPVGTDTGLTVADLSVGDCSLAMNAKDVYVLRDELGFYAMSSRCTHVGCLLPCPVNDLMLCPCHGSRFNANGDLLSGIAMSDLEHFLVSFECVDDEVKIYVDTSQPLADRQTRAPA